MNAVQTTDVFGQKVVTGALVFYFSSTQFIERFKTLLSTLLSKFLESTRLGRGPMTEKYK